MLRAKGIRTRAALAQIQEQIHMVMMLASRTSEEVHQLDLSG
jgi:hypothetical protein